MVVPIHPPSGRKFNISDRFVRAVMKHRGADTFGFIDAVDALHQGIIVRIADRPDRRGDPVKFELLAPRNCSVLRPRIGVRYELACLNGVPSSVAFPQSDL